MSVLILGATSRIARELASRYAEKGLAVAVAARDEGEAERIASDLAVRYQVPTQAVAFDATDFDSHPRLVEAVGIELGPIEVALVAFGDMADQAAAQQDFATARRIIDVNYTGAASICEALASHMEARNRGAIVGITSVAGDRGRQSNYFYGSAKGAFDLYLGGLRNRLFAAEVRVLTVRLGFVDTRMTYDLETGIPIADPADISRQILAALDRGEEVVYLPRFWQGVMGIIKAIPETVFKRLKL